MDRANSRKPSESLKKMLNKQGQLLNAEPSISRMFFNCFIINGVQYCRPHLLIHCHLCEVDSSSCQDDCDEQREKLSLRRGGDARLNERAEKWKCRILEKLFVMTHKVEQTNGAGIPPGLRMEMKTSERELNDEFLADVAQAFKDGASQCCYWGCKAPDAEKLLKCSGCGVVRYCSKEHQSLDWKWEHKFECTKSVPKFLLTEIEEDRQRNLRGNYDSIDRD